MRSSVSSPAYFLSCGIAPMRAELEDPVVAADAWCGPRSRSAGRSSVPAPMRTCGADDRVRADADRRVELGAPGRRSRSDGSCVMPRGRPQARRCAPCTSASASTASSPSTVARARELEDARLHALDASTSRISWSPGSTGALEARAVDAGEVVDACSRPATLAVGRERQQRRGLRQRLEHQHAGHHRAVREVAVEERLVDR